ncbi:hypothetical protein ABFA07_002223 [Porites harrisoni]
MISNYLVE